MHTMYNRALFRMLEKVLETKIFFDYFLISDLDPSPLFFSSRVMHILKISSKIVYFDLLHEL